MTPIETALALLWALLLLKSRLAIIPAFILLADLCLIHLGAAYSRYLLIALLYFYASSLNIRILSGFRKALWCAGLLYFLGAVDELLYQWLNISTLYYDAMPCLVVITCAYIAATLFTPGGYDNVRVDVKCSRSFVSRFFGLQ